MIHHGNPSAGPIPETAPSTGPTGAPLRKIAMVVVHGVGAQVPGESLRAVGDLLLRPDVDSDCSVRELGEGAVRVPLRQVQVAADAGGPGKKPGIFARLFSFDERSRYARKQLSKRRSRDVAPPGDMGYEFMRAQLAGYRRDAAGIPELAYEAACLEGSVHRPTGGAIAELHVHEMFWADLGKVGSGILSVFGHIYQLLFHLPSLGRNTADFAAIENADVSGWRMFMRLRNAAGRLMTLPIPILNLVLVMASLVALSGSVPAGQSSKVAAVALACLIALGLLLFGLWRRPPRQAWVWFLVPIAAGAAVLFPLIVGARHWPEHSLAIEAWLLSGIGVAAVLRTFARFRPGALGTGLLFLLGFSVWFGVECAAAGNAPIGNATIGLHLLQVTICALGFSWVALALCFALALLASVYAIARTPADRRRKARHAVWTAHATLGLSSALVLILNLSLWSAVFNTAGRFLTAGSIAPLYLTFCRDGLGPVVRTSELARQLLVSRAGWGFLAALAAFALLVLAAVWGLFPSILAEIHPPKTSEPDAAALDRSDPERARRFGAWLCRGFPVIAGAALLLGPAVIVGVTADLLRLQPPSLETLLWISGAAVLALIGGKAWLSSIGTLIGIMLEVDNYMREHPRDSAPRARIAERFVSLLRHLGRSGADGAGAYDAVVIVAHSQGTVIAADLLRFLAAQRRCHQGAECDPELEWLQGKPLYLFTMGCPLRQLYGWCFPHLYDWVEPSSPWPGPAPQAAFIPGDAPPEPSQLGDNVLWLNAYRTSDYVGRSLWVADDAACAWMRCHPGVSNPRFPTVIADSAGTRLEACIGEGAHTHYWDATAGDVAWLLKRLVCIAAGAGGAPSTGV